MQKLLISIDLCLQQVATRSPQCSATLRLWCCVSAAPRSSASPLEGKLVLQKVDKHQQVFSHQFCTGFKLSYCICWFSFWPDSCKRDLISSYVTRLRLFICLCVALSLHPSWSGCQLRHTETLAVVTEIHHLWFISTQSTASTNAPFILTFSWSSFESCHQEIVLCVYERWSDRLRWSEHFEEILFHVASRWIDGA